MWRGLDYGGILVEIEYHTHRIQCPEHGIVTAAVPWAYPDSSFTREFDLTVAWLAKYLPRSAVAAYMRIDWQTVGNCVSRALHGLEPERSRRLDGLVNIGIDETSYRKGHKYITVIVNHDTNKVVWVANGHGLKVLEQFPNEDSLDRFVCCYYSDLNRSYADRAQRSFHLVSAELLQMFVSPVSPSNEVESAASDISLLGGMRELVGEYVYFSVSLPV